MIRIDSIDLGFVTGGADEPQPKKANYLTACVRGGVDGAIQGATAGAGMLPFAAASGPLAPATVGTFLGVGAGGGGAIGCAQGMWELYKARNPVTP